MPAVDETMKFLVIVAFAAICALALQIPTNEEQIHTDFVLHHKYHTYTIANKNYLKRYKDVLRLFKHVHQAAYDKDHIKIANQYCIETNIDGYSNAETVQEFVLYHRQGMLSKDEIFSVFHDRHLKQAVALFRVLYHAKDFDTFYKTAVWARYNLNHGLFLYAFSVAIIHRHDTYSMILPPMYEVYPYYFFNAEVIQKSHKYKQLYFKGLDNEEEYLINTNYSGPSLCSYFTEDIGINSYYYYYNLYRPFWMDTKEYEINTYHRGEEFYYFYQQLLARYYLERLSNGVGKISIRGCQRPHETDYCPSLRYPSGVPFPSRTSNPSFFATYYNYEQSCAFEEEAYVYHNFMDYERRIRDAIDAGFVYTEDGKTVNLYEKPGFNALGNIIESNPDSPNKRLYGYLQIITRQLKHECKIIPSALEHFETSLRDPDFWTLYKRLILYFQKYKSHLLHYTYDDIAFPGVKIENMQVSPLVTYFEKYDIDLINAVYVNEQEWNQNLFAMHVRQNRLNHKPFTYKIYVTSETVAKSVVRVFIGPKYDEYGRFIDIHENRMNFVEFDRFIHEVKAGKNVIERNCHENFFASDRTSYKQLYEDVNAGIEETKLFTTHGSEVYYAFPNRFLLPKGKRGGQIYQFYVLITPYKAPSLLLKKQQEQEPHQSIYEELHEGQEYEYFKYPMVGLGIQYLDDYPLGYPLDRPIDELNFYVPNGHFHDVVIYHE